MLAACVCLPTLLATAAPETITEVRLTATATAGQGNGWRTIVAFQGADYGLLRGYFRWDLAGIPTSAVIHRATISVCISGAYETETSVSVIAREVTADWTEGGEFQNPSLATVDLGPPTAWPAGPGYRTKELPKGLLQTWIEGTRANHGVMLSKTTSPGYMTIMNRVSDNPPYLTVSYSTPAPVAPDVAATTTVVQSRNTRITFECRGNRARLVGLADIGSRRQFIRPYSDMPGLWRVEFRKPDGNDLDLELLDSDVTAAQPQVTAADGGAIAIAWNGLALAEESNAVDVLVTVTPVADTMLSDWRIEVANRSKIYGIWGVRFPRIHGLVAGPDAEATTPFGSGMVVKDPLHQQFGFSGRYPSALYSMQFCALSDRGVSLYMATHDPRAYVKEMRYQQLPGDHGLVYEVNQLPENMGVPGTSYRQPYACVVGTLPGDWVDTAKVYRTWVLGSSEWMKGKRPLAVRTDIPEAIKRLPYWVGFHGMTEDAMVSIEHLLDSIGVPAAVHLYHWHEIDFDTHYPDFWPPRDVTFEYVKRLHARGALVMPYTNQHLMDEASASWVPDQASAYVAMAPGGRASNESWSAGPGVKLHPMCPATYYWQGKFDDLAVRLVRDLDVDGIYCDQVACVPPDLCFDPTHGHPLGGGNHWWAGHSRQIAAMRQAAATAKKGIFFTSESAAEPYDFDISLRCNEGAPFLAPVWQMVYSGYRLSYGFYFYDEPEWIVKFATQYLWGMQIGWAGQHDPADMPETCAFEREVARARYAASDYLAMGEMLRPPKLTGNEARIKTEWRNFGSVMPIDWPAVQGSTWRAVDGSIGLALVNMHNAPQTVEFELHRADLGLEPGRVRLRALVPEGLLEDVDLDTASLSQAVTLPARAAVMLVMTQE